jgi:magnesium-transporting ATPase (P-type)
MSKTWHAMEIEETLADLNSKENGLTQEEARKRLEQFGPSELKKEKRAR